MVETSLKKEAIRHRQKMFTTNNHYEWSKTSRAGIAMSLMFLSFHCNSSKISIHVIVQKLVIAQQVVVVIQVIPRDVRLGRMRYIIHLHAPAQVRG